MATRIYSEGLSSIHFNTSFVNHQKWHIECCFEENILFRLRDPWGDLYVVSEYIVENLDGAFVDHLLQLDPKKQQAFLYDCLQARLHHATPHQVHVEGARHIVRFGDYGLKGGGKNGWGVFFSIGQIGCGIVLGTQTTRIKYLGKLLIATGISSGLYALREAQERYSWKGYGKHMGYGGCSGIVSSSFAELAEGLGTVSRIGCSALEGVVESALLSSVSDRLEKGQWPEYRSLAQRACIAGLGRSTGALASIPISPLLNHLTGEIGEDLIGIVIQTLQGFLEGFANGVGNRAAVNVCEGKNLTEELFQQGVLNALINGCIAGAEKINRLIAAHLAVQAIQDAKDVDLLIEAHTKQMRDLAAALKAVQKTFEEELQARKEGKGRPLQDVLIEVLPNLSATHEVTTQMTHFLDKTLRENYPEFYHMPVNQLNVVRKDFTQLKAVQMYQKLQSQSMGSQQVLFKIFKSEGVSFVDFGMQDLIPHVVLVEALTDNAAQYFPGVDLDRCLVDPVYKLLCCIKAVIDAQGMLGPHLKQLREGEFTDRPHLHWSWNQLVQPHTDSWENAQMAVLEPLAVFENASHSKPFGVAPYDTLTMGAHRLSNRSVLLVPHTIADGVRAYLPHLLPGQVVPYDPIQQTLRSAIITTLNAHYPQVWHVCDERGHLIGAEVRRTAAGYQDKTCLKTSDVGVLILLRNEGLRSAEQVSRSMQEYIQARRFIGLHIHSTTILLEDDPYFRTLKSFKEFRTVVKEERTKRFFAASATVENLGVLAAFDKVYHPLTTAYDAATGSGDVADYVINQAFSADLASLFFQKNPDGRFDLSPLELRFFLESARAFLIPMAAQMNNAVKENQLDSARSTFTDYQELLRSCYTDLQTAKQETLSLRDLTGKEGPLGNHLLFSVGQAEWNQMPLENSIEFDLGKHWPPQEKFIAYGKQVYAAIPPTDAEIKNLYQELLFFAQPHLPLRDRYRLNVVLSIVEWTYRERIYCTLRKTVESALAQKFSGNAAL